MSRYFNSGDICLFVLNQSIETKPEILLKFLQFISIKYAPYYKKSFQWSQKFKQQYSFKKMFLPLYQLLHNNVHGVAVENTEAILYFQNT